MFGVKVSLTLVYYFEYCSVNNIDDPEEFAREHKKEMPFMYREVEDYYSEHIVSSGNHNKVIDLVQDIKSEMQYCGSNREIMNLLCGNELDLDSLKDIYKCLSHNDITSIGNVCLNNFIKYLGCILCGADNYNKVLEELKIELKVDINLSMKRMSTGVAMSSEHSVSNLCKLRNTMIECKKQKFNELGDFNKTRNNIYLCKRVPKQYSSNVKKVDNILDLSAEHRRINGCGKLLLIMGEFDYMLSYTISNIEKVSEEEVRAGLYPFRSDDISTIAREFIKSKMFDKKSLPNLLNLEEGNAERLMVLVYKILPERMKEGRFYVEEMFEIKKFKLKMIEQIILTLCDMENCKLMSSNLKYILSYVIETKGRLDLDCNTILRKYNKSVYYWTLEQYPPIIKQPECFSQLVEYYLRVWYSIGGIKEDKELNVCLGKINNIE